MTVSNNVYDSGGSTYTTIASVDATDQVVFTQSTGGQTGTADGDLCRRAAQNCADVPSGEEANKTTSVTITADSGDDIVFTSDASSRDYVTVTIDGAGRRLRYSELTKAITNALND